MIDRTYQNHHSSKGSAEDEPSDGEPKFAKIRPMRVEMYGMNWNDSWGKIHNEAIVETLHATSTQRAETRSNSFHTLQRAAGRLLHWK